jgi:hypothetical protein
MSSPEGEDDVAADNHDTVANSPHGAIEEYVASDGDSEPDSFSRTKPPDELESGSASPALGLNGASFQGYTRIVRESEMDEEDVPSSPDLRPLEEEVERERVVSPGDSVSTMETPDDTPSIQVNSPNHSPTF